MTLTPKERFMNMYIREWIEEKEKLESKHKSDLERQAKEIFDDFTDNSVMFSLDNPKTLRRWVDLRRKWFTQSAEVKKE